MDMKLTFHVGRSIQRLKCGSTWKRHLNGLNGDHVHIDFAAGVLKSR